MCKVWASNSKLCPKVFISWRKAVLLRDTYNSYVDLLRRMNYTIYKDISVPDDRDILNEGQEQNSEKIQPKIWKKKHRLHLPMMLLFNIYAPEINTDTI